MSDDEPAARRDAQSQPGPAPGTPGEGDQDGGGSTGGKVSIARRPTPDPIPPYALTSDDSAATRAKRFWSARRVPAGIVAAVLLGLAGLFLYDIASVRAGRKAMQWRVTLADELATRHLDDVWIILGASVAAALGLWLVLLAVTPGERGVLPMARRTTSGVRAGLDRRAAELVLRDRAMEVPGIRWARINVGRRRITARTAAGFRELDEVRAELTAALTEAVRQLGLARPLALRIHVQRAEKKG